MYWRKIISILLIIIYMEIYYDKKKGLYSFEINKWFVWKVIGRVVRFVIWIVWVVYWGCLWDEFDLYE